MRVVTLEELGGYPPGTIFSDFRPCIVSELYRLGRVLPYDGGDHTHYRQGQIIDFYHISLLPDPEMETCYKEAGDDPETGFEIADGWSRWGCYDLEALFLVYSTEDVAKLVKYLTAPIDELGTIEGVTH